jgi:hypothetical protein
MPLASEEVLLGSQQTLFSDQNQQQFHNLQKVEFVFDYLD